MATRGTHGEQTIANGIHTPMRWSWADSTARTAEVDVLQYDVDERSLGIQVDDNTLWRASSIGPIVWATLAGGAGAGDVTGPASSTDNAMARFNSTTGKLLQDGTALVLDDGSIQATAADAATAAVTAAADLRHNTSGTPATDFGTGVAVKAETTTTVDTIIGAIEWAWGVATHASRRGYVRLRAARGSGNVVVAHIEAPSTDPADDGNARGAGATDLQGDRSAATQVASGEDAVIGGGENNTSSGFGTTVVGGGSNIASDFYATVIGGELNQATEQYSVASGNGAVAEIFGQFAHGMDSTVRDRTQYTVNVNLQDSITHSGTAFVNLILSGAEGSPAIPVDTAWFIEAKFVGITIDAVKAFAFIRRALVKNTDGTTSVVEVKTDDFDTEDTLYDATIVADDTNDEIDFQVRRTSADSVEVLWHCAASFNEVRWST